MGGSPQCIVRDVRDIGCLQLPHHGLAQHILPKYTVSTGPAIFTDLFGGGITGLNAEKALEIWQQPLVWILLMGGTRVATPAQNAFSPFTLVQGLQNGPPLKPMLIHAGMHLCGQCRQLLTDACAYPPTQAVLRCNEVDVPSRVRRTPVLRGLGVAERRNTDSQLSGASPTCQLVTECVAQCMSADVPHSASHISACRTAHSSIHNAHRISAFPRHMTTAISRWLHVVHGRGLLVPIP